MIQDSLWKVLAIILCVIMVFIVPLMSTYQRQEQIAYNIMLNEANHFSQKVREIGYIDQVLLDELSASIQSLGFSYEISLEHKIKRFGSYNGEYKVFYEGVYTRDIYKVLELEEKYQLAVGDFFFIRIRNTSTTAYSKIKNLLGMSSENLLYVVSGGIVRYGDS